uniref:Ddb1 and cul4 associated factor 13 n=1 Tax=Cyprinus carpio carpio TaxID=630221 RepID=A0A9J8D867_CYPCA
SAISVFCCSVSVGNISLHFQTLIFRKYRITTRPCILLRGPENTPGPTKLERVFAKPFVASLDGHRAHQLHHQTQQKHQAQSLLCLHIRTLLDLFSMDECAHAGFVIFFFGTSIFTVEDDKSIKQWNIEAPVHGVREEPINMILGKVQFYLTDIISKIIYIIIKCRNSITDEITSLPSRRALKSFNAQVAMRYCLHIHVYIHSHTHTHTHTHTRISIYISFFFFFFIATSSQTQRFSILLISHNPQVYHTKHMQHVICVRWSADNKYVLSGSDEMNIRLWKANASEKLGLVTATNYNKKLIEKFQHHPQVKHIARHLHLPRDVLKQKRELREMKEAWRRKEQNVRKHRKLGFVPLLTEKEKHVVAVMEQELI